MQLGRFLVDDESILGTGNGGRVLVGIGRQSSAAAYQFKALNALGKVAGILHLFFRCALHLQFEGGDEAVGKAEGNLGGAVVLHRCDVLLGKGDHALILTDGVVGALGENGIPYLQAGKGVAGLGEGDGQVIAAGLAAKHIFSVGFSSTALK